MILINILQKIFGKKKKKAETKPKVNVTLPSDIDPLTGKKRVKIELEVVDTYEADTMKLFNKLLTDFQNNNIQLSEVKRKYQQKVLDNLGSPQSTLYIMLYNLLYMKPPQVDIINVDKKYLETEKNKSTFDARKNAIVNFSETDRINFVNEISNTGQPIIPIVNNIKNLYDKIDAKKYFNFKLKIKSLYDKDLKYYRNTYGYLKDTKFDLIAPDIRVLPAQEKPSNVDQLTGERINESTGPGTTTAGPSIADLYIRPNQIGTIYPNWENKTYLTSEFVIYNGLTYKNAAQIIGNNNNTPDKDSRWQRI